MNMDITRLKSGIDPFVAIDEELQISKEMIQKVDLLDLKDVKVSGQITKDYVGNYMLDCIVRGIMVVPCALTLKPVDYPFEAEVNGNIEELLEEMNEIDKKTENSIDIFPIIWENILMEIPMKVVSKEAEDIKLEGNGWKLVTEQTKEEVNPELQKLKDLLNEK